MGRRAGGVIAVSTVVVLGGSAAEPVPAPPATPPASSSTVTVYGRPGTFGAAPGAVPSGQSLATRPVAGFGFPAGLQAARVALAGDGSVLVAGTSQNLDFREVTAGEMAVGAYDPRADAFTAVRIRTSTGQDRMADPAGRPAAPSVADLEPVAGGAAIAFTAWPTYRGRHGADGGRWPVFGILSKVDGSWSVARGAGWANQWTGVDLRTGCGDEGAPDDAMECGGPDQMASLPRSRDLIVTRAGGLLALRVTGPDAEGRFAVAVTGQFRYPQVRQPGTTDPADVALWQVQADPTGVPGDERFVATVQIRDRDAIDVPAALQEFSYDAGSGTIRPVSAPFLPGDHTDQGVYGYGAALYDNAGNLWAARADALRGGSLAVYANRGGRRRPGSTACPFDPKRPMDSYTTTGAGRRFWGQSCRPDYDILQAARLHGMHGLMEDPVTHDIVGLALGGALLPVRPSGTGDAMTFRIGNLVDVGRKLLPNAEGTWAEQRTGVVDAAHRLWLSGQQARLRQVGAALDQWLYAVDLGDLFAPRPIAIPDTPGRSVVIQAEQTVTSGTSQRAGPSGAILVDSDAYFTGCVDWPPNVGCGYDGNPGNGFSLADDTGFGHLRGAVEFRVRVGRPGDFRLSYRAAALPVTTTARIEFGAGGRTFSTAVPGGAWSTVSEPEIVTLPTGEQTIRLSVPPGGGGWYLNSLTLQRV